MQRNEANIDAAGFAAVPGRPSAAEHATARATQKPCSRSWPTSADRRQRRQLCQKPPGMPVSIASSPQCPIDRLGRRYINRLRRHAPHQYNPRPQCRLLDFRLRCRLFNPRLRCRPLDHLLQCPHQHHRLRRRLSDLRLRCRMHHHRASAETPSARPSSAAMPPAPSPAGTPSARPSAAMPPAPSSAETPPALPSAGTPSARPSAIQAY